MSGNKMYRKGSYLENLIDEPNVLTLQTQLGFGLDAFKKEYKLPVASMTQVHGKTIANFDDFDGDLDCVTIDGVDGLITSRTGIAISVKTADCLPILIYHPSGVISGLHAGRRGTDKQILVEALTIFRTRYGLKKGFRIWFGPCICKDCYQIDRASNLHYDLDYENKQQLDSVLDDSDYDLRRCGVCTTCHPSLFYSYRRDGGSSRQYSLIALVTA